MYSHLSDENPDGYNLINQEPVFTLYADSSDVHIYDASFDSLHGNKISRRWETYGNVKFVKYNDFDYANATNVSLQTAYNSGVKKKFASNIQDDDIILVKVHDSYLIAVKVLAVFDPYGFKNDRYIFNIKK
jgi:hypothetical protein